MVSFERQDYEILGTEWLTDGEGNCIGAVAIKTYGDKWKCYFGLATGADEDLDALAIAKLGAKLPKTVACAFFPALPAEEWTA